MEMHGSPRWEWHGRDQRMLSYLHLYSGSETINSLSSSLVAVCGNLTNIEDTKKTSRLQFNFMQKGRRSTHDGERNWTARLGPREASTQTSAGAAPPPADEAPRQHGSVGIGASVQNSSLCGSADGQDGSRKVFGGSGRQRQR
jgi:hypothetical protein